MGVTIQQVQDAGLKVAQMRDKHGKDSKQVAEARAEWKALDSEYRRQFGDNR